LSEGGDQRLEEGVFAFSELSLDLLESGFNLGEGDTGLQVLDDLGGFVDSFDLLVVLGILVDPGLVLVGSELGLGGEGVLVVLDVLGDEPDFLLGLGEGVGGVLSELGEGDDLGLVVGDGLFEVVDELLAGDLVVLVDGISSLLVALDLGGDVVGQEVDLVDGGSGGEVQLDDGEDGVAESVFVDFGENGFGVLEFVLLIGESQGND